MSCTKAPDLSKIENLNENTISIFGHGGMGYTSFLPTNSLASIQRCLNLGAAGTEIDIQLTKDHVFIVFHDEKLENTTNRTGKIHEMTWAEIKGATYNGFKQQEPVISLEELFENIPNLKNYIFTFDCKILIPATPTYRKQFNTELVRVIEKFDMADNVFIELRQDKVIKELVAQKPNYKVFALSDFNNALALAEKFKLYGISVSDKETTAEEVNLAHQKGLKVTFYTSKRKSNIVEKNPDYIQTDKLRYFLDLFGSD